MHRTRAIILSHVCICLQLVPMSMVLVLLLAPLAGNVRVFMGRYLLPVSKLHGESQQQPMLDHHIKQKKEEEDNGDSQQHEVTTEMEATV